MKSSFLYSIVLVAVIGGLLFGYDTAVISGAENGLQAFFRSAADFEYGDFLHGITSSSALIGCVLGSAISGLLANRLGRKRSLVVAGILFFLSALGSYYPEFMFFERGVATLPLLWMFNAYRILGGIGVGLASAICPMYIGEVSPADKRGMLVSCNQFAIIFGQLVVYFVNLLIAQHVAIDSWRVMFVSEAVPAGLFAFLICFVPETPRYLALMGREAEALNVLTRINGAEEARTILADIKATALQKTEPILAYGWLVIVVGILLSVFQQAVGINAVLYFAPRIFASVGMGNPMLQTVLMGVVNISFTVLAILTVERWGRKPLLIWGSLGMAVGALAFALCQVVTLPPFVSVICIMVYSACFMFSWGPICWVLIAEIFPNTIRGAAVAVAVAAQWISNFIVSSTFVPMYTASPAGTYALYGVICLIAALFVWRLVPETKGKTLEQMTALWRKK